MDKITECLRPRKKINQSTLPIQTKNKDNLSSRTNIIKIDLRIIDDKTPEETIRIFGSYQKYKKK